MPKVRQATWLVCSEWGIAVDTIEGTRASSRGDLGYSQKFHFPLVKSLSFLTCECVLGTLWSSIKQIKAPCVFYWEHGIAVHATQGNRASSLAEGDVSLFFSSCSGNLGYILEFWLGGSFKTRICSAMSGLLSIYNGYLRSLN